MVPVDFPLDERIQNFGERSISVAYDEFLIKNNISNLFLYYRQQKKRDNVWKGEGEGNTWFRINSPAVDCNKRKLFSVIP